MMNLDELNAWNDKLTALLAEDERGLATWNEAVANHLEVLTKDAKDTGYLKGVVDTETHNLRKQNTDWETNVLDAACREFGEPLQLVILVEELSELIHEITSIWRYKRRLCNASMVSEIADVQVCINSLIRMMDKDAPAHVDVKKMIRESMNTKLAILAQRIKEHERAKNERLGKHL